MRDEDRTEFANGLHALGQTFNEPVSDIRAECYWDALKDLHLESWQYAVRQAVKSCKFFPKPVELRELVAGGVNTRAVPSAEETGRMLNSYHRHRVRELTDGEVAERNALMERMRHIAGKFDMNRAITDKADA